MKEKITSWQNRRISAINRWSKKRGIPCNDLNPYFNEYNAILSSQSKTKKQYKGEKMTDQTKWGIPLVQSENKARMHEEKKKKEIPSYTLDELKVSHHNHILDSENSMLKEELNKIKTFQTFRVRTNTIVFLRIFPRSHFWLVAKIIQNT